MNNLNNVPAELRPGYNNTVRFSAETQYPRDYIIKLTSNSVSVSSQLEIEKYFSYFLIDYFRKIKNILNEENTVTSNGILSFLEALMIFCNNTIKFYTTPLLPGRNCCVVFVPSTVYKSSIKSRIQNLPTNEVLLYSIIDRIISDMALLQKGTECNRIIVAGYQYSYIQH